MLGQRERRTVGLRGPGTLQLLLGRLPLPLSVGLESNSFTLQVSPSRLPKLGANQSVSQPIGRSVGRSIMCNTAVRCGAVRGGRGNQRVRVARLFLSFLLVRFVLIN